MALEILGRSIRSEWISTAMREFMEGVVHGPFAMQKVHDCAPNLAICMQEF